MDFICLAAFSQLCCRQKDKSGGSSFSFLELHVKKRNGVKLAADVALHTDSRDLVISSERHSNSPVWSPDEMNSSVLHNSIK